MTNTTWHDVVKRAIAEQCRAAYLQANTARNGALRRKHMPYSVPDLARAMIAALDNNDEYEGKRLLLIWRTNAFSLF
jgi:hypothetical protein